VAERADSLENELFSIVACLEPGPIEFRHPLYQRLQARCFFRILPLILDQQRKKMLAWPLGRVTKVDMEPPSEGAFLAVTENNL
jgi:hypothetical protein